MNHTTVATVLGMLAIAAVLIGAVGISSAVQSAAADPRNSIHIEKSTTHFKFKQKLKNNCSDDSTNCCNIASQIVVDLSRAIIVPLSVTPVPLCPIED